MLIWLIVGQAYSTLLEHNALVTFESEVHLQTLIVRVVND
jgi:hypothetical protein